MINEIFSTVEKIFTDFSWKKIFTLIIVVIVLAASYFIIDKTTQFFSLSRIEREANLLEKIALIRVEEDTDLNSIRQTLVEKLKSSVNTDVGIQGFLGLPIAIPEWFFLGFSVSVPWFLISIPFFLGTLKNEESSRNSFIGMIIIGIIFGLIGSVIPVFFGEGFRYYIFPVILFFCTLVPISIIGNRNIASKNKDKNSNGT